MILYSRKKVSVAIEQKHVYCHGPHECSYTADLFIFGMFMISWILRVSCKVSEAKGFTFTLQETQSIHDSMNIPKMEFIAYIYLHLIINIENIKIIFS